ncbi:GAF domain-containing sensor histidine kinase [Cognatishimia maritima]|uniref:Signal transduction histidine kinase n=1 Tax=Cognatishimia maritima TaxID=870908 RepID=A0A1M5QGJ1_9RHOB|nr:GAF domain-containing sensor histidine kinase [Cognatishimia maritima]SHH12976.1 Signal transduction histidine kinase [Cognatishimia maritima]
MPRSPITQTNHIEVTLKRNSEYGQLHMPEEGVSALMPNAGEALDCYLSIAQAIAGPTDYELVLENFANRLRALIAHDHLDIVLLHPAGMQICYEARMHTSWSHTQSPARPTEESPIRDVLRGDTPYILTDDAWTDPRFHFEGSDSKPLFDANLHSRIVVPLRVQGALIGSLAISSHKTDFYNEELVVLAQGAADLISAYLFALERGKEAKESAVAELEATGREQALRLGALRLTEGMERERQRLGMDLHDQTLADLARIRRRMSRIDGGSVAAQKEINALQDELDHCLDEVRGIVEAMKPGVLQMFGFSEAVEAHLQRCQKHMRREIKMRVQDQTDGQMDTLQDTVRTAMFRIVQEAVNNALKHTACDCIDVRISQDGPNMFVRVDDNGTGISEADLQSKSGISNIKTRADLISATVRFERLADPKGTRVEISVPQTAGQAAGEPLAL